jgi:hypothetical protein
MLIPLFDVFPRHQLQFVLSLFFFIHLRPLLVPCDLCIYFLSFPSFATFFSRSRTAMKQLGEVQATLDSNRTALTSSRRQTDTLQDAVSDLTQQLTEKEREV